jgi:hypothetical protein
MSAEESTTNPSTPTTAERRALLESARNKAKATGELASASAAKNQLDAARKNADLAGDELNSHIRMVRKFFTRGDNEDVVATSSLIAPIMQSLGMRVPKLTGYANPQSASDWMSTEVSEKTATMILDCGDDVANLDKTKQQVRAVLRKAEVSFNALIEQPARLASQGKANPLDLDRLEEERDRALAERNAFEAELLETRKSLEEAKLNVVNSEDVDNIQELFDKSDTEIAGLKTLLKAFVVMITGEESSSPKEALEDLSKLSPLSLHDAWLQNPAVAAFLQKLRGHHIDTIGQYLDSWSRSDGKPSPTPPASEPVRRPIKSILPAGSGPIPPPPAKKVREVVGDFFGSTPRG